MALPSTASPSEWIHALAILCFALMLWYLGPVDVVRVVTSHGYVPCFSYVIVHVTAPRWQVQWLRRCIRTAYTIRCSISTLAHCIHNRNVFFISNRRRAEFQPADQHQNPRFGSFTNTVHRLQQLRRSPSSDRLGQLCLRHQNQQQNSHGKLLQRRSSN